MIKRYHRRSLSHAQHRLSCREGTISQECPWEDNMDIKRRREVRDEQNFHTVLKLPEVPYKISSL